MILYTYSFIFPDGTEKLFPIELDSNTCYLNPVPLPGPFWTRLTVQQCQHCQLTENSHLHCPVAINIAELINEFHDIISYSDCTVICRSQARTVSKNTCIQDGLSSILGIIMATSGCPSMEILKPLARFHLPFATVEETLFRSVSAYMLRQYFVGLDGAKADFSLSNITNAYKEIQQVNAGILQRIKQAVQSDADANAIVILNNLTQILELEIEDKLESLRPLFTVARSC